jgi:hypothetical protein
MGIFINDLKKAKAILEEEKENGLRNARELILPILERFKKELPEEKTSIGKLTQPDNEAFFGALVNLIKKSQEFFKSLKFANDSLVFTGPISRGSKMSVVEVKNKKAKDALSFLELAIKDEEELFDAIKKAQKFLKYEEHFLLGNIKKLRNVLKKEKRSIE